MSLPLNPLGGEKLPFETEEQRAALIGRKVLYVERAEVDYTGGRPHVFPRSAGVKAADHTAILTDAGVWLDVADIQFIVAGA